VKCPITRTACACSSVYDCDQMHEDTASPTPRTDEALEARQDATDAAKLIEEEGYLVPSAPSKEDKVENAKD
jgi:hypothetical protein